jgi:arsenate reductase-like glutaredoxin family protein
MKTNVTNGTEMSEKGTEGYNENNEVNMSEASMCSRSYLRASTDKNLHKIADMIDELIERRGTTWKELTAANAKIKELESVIDKMTEENSKHAYSVLVPLDEYDALTEYKTMWQSIAGKANLQGLMDRVKELETELVKQQYLAPLTGDILESLTRSIEQLQSHNQILREACEFYADRDNWTASDDKISGSDLDKYVPAGLSVSFECGGKRARQALQRTGGEG